jgi:uncharacterized protein
MSLSPRIWWAFPDEQVEHHFDCDCACSLPALRPPLELSNSSLLWEYPSNLYIQPLLSNHSLIFNPFGQAGPIVLNESARAILDRFALPQTLDQPIARRLAALGVLQPQGAKPSPPQIQPETLTAWLHVTNQCNLRCTYCYIHKTEEAMDEATGLAAVETVFRSAEQYGFKTVKLKYAGGEASLNFKLVRRLHQYAQSLANQTGLKLQAVLLSNGVALSPALLHFIQTHDIRLMISLDGLGPTHDRQRSFANGKGSFKLVAAGINRAIAYGIQPHLSITVTGGSAEGIAEAVAFALDRDLPFNLNFYRDNDYAKDQTQLQAEDQQLILAMRAAFAVIEEKLPRRSLISTLIDRSNFSGSHTHTCGVGNNYLVINHKGRIAHCHMEIERTVTDVFAHDPLLLIRNQETGFQNLSVDDKEGCRDCYWRYWCTGGCPLLTYRVTGRNDVKSPYCNVYKALYPDLLRLEGLRLLKWQNTSI